MRCRLSGAYDPYPVLILRIWIGVNDQQKSDRANHANDMPALLSILDPIREDDVQRIVPTFSATSKAKPCLARFLLAFSGFHSKFTTRADLRICMHRQVNSQVEKPPLTHGNRLSNTRLRQIEQSQTRMSCPSRSVSA